MKELKKYKHQIIEIKKLKPYSKNSRTHSTEQIKQIMESIKAFGFTNPLLIDDDFNLIAGHGRLEAIKQLNQVEFANNPILELPCIIVSGLSEMEQKALVIADNKIALNAGWDMKILGEELFELENANFDMSLTGFNENELVEILGEFDNCYNDDFSIPNTERKPFRQITITFNDHTATKILEFLKSADECLKKGNEPNINANIIFNCLKARL